MRPGVRLGIDVGLVRIGVARSDPSGLMAVPIETVARTLPRFNAGATANPEPSADISRIRELVAEYSVLEIIVGQPLSLSGGENDSTKDAIAFGSALLALGVPIRMVDERLSTVSAGRLMQSVGKSARKQRSVIDQSAAVIILQHALDSERSSNLAAGRLLSETGFLS